MLSENEIVFGLCLCGRTEDLELCNLRSNKTLSIPGREAGYASLYVVYPGVENAARSITSFMKQIVPCRY